MFFFSDDSSILRKVQLEFVSDAKNAHLFPEKEDDPQPQRKTKKAEAIFNLRSKSSSAKNFAVHLVRFYFTPQELEGRNVRGVGNKLPLDMDKILKVKEIVFKFFPLAGSQQEILWRDCRKAIDAYLRNRKTMDVPRSS